MVCEVIGGLVQDPAESRSVVSDSPPMKSVRGKYPLSFEDLNEVNLTMARTFPVCKGTEPDSLAHPSRTVCCVA